MPKKLEANPEQLPENQTKKTPSAVMPALILTIIITLVSAVLIVTNATLATDPNQLDDIYAKKAETVLGGGAFSVITWEDAGLSGTQPEKVLRVIGNTDTGKFAREIAADGYTKNGLTLLIAPDDNWKVGAIAIVASTETPGLGTKVEKPDFLSKFAGAGAEVAVTKSAPKAANEIQGVTGATRSSVGVSRAVNVAISVFSEQNNQK